MLFGFKRVTDDDEGVVNHHKAEGDGDADAGFATMRLDGKGNRDERESETGERKGKLAMDLDSDGHGGDTLCFACVAFADEFFDGHFAELRFALSAEERGEINWIGCDRTTFHEEPFRRFFRGRSDE